MRLNVIYGRYLVSHQDVLWGNAGGGLCAGLEMLREGPASRPWDPFISPRARAIVGVTSLAETCVDVENELTPVFDVETGEEPA